MSGIMEIGSCKAQLRTPFSASREAGTEFVSLVRCGRLPIRDIFIMGYHHLHHHPNCNDQRMTCDHYRVDLCHDHRSEEHKSELLSRENLVSRLLPNK